MRDSYLEYIKNSQNSQVKIKEAKNPTQKMGKKHEETFY